ncbi:unnamed protein product [Phaedon cochleariae]|uniref:Thioesterase domain-containing protein n=1 Tax=Phaedon cochleariae TaxID=80249 RepID=A0A9N9SHN4_PHACE|nr:unnamed protein product [Phaedon cochleariae]
MMAGGAAKMGAEHFATYLKNSRYFEKCIQKLKIISAGEGKCTALLKVDEDHINPFGTLHGGLSATLVDTVSSWALLTHDNVIVNSVSVDIKMSYLKAAPLGQEVQIDADTIRVGKTLAFLKAYIKNKETGELLVEGSHTKFFIRS